MKNVNHLSKLILIFCLTFFCFSISVGQEKGAYRKVFDKFEALIKDVCAGEEFSEDLNAFAEEFINQIRLEDIDNISDDRIKKLLDMSNEYRVAYLLREIVDMKISKYRYEQEPAAYHQKIKALKQKRKLIDQHLRLLIDTDYLHYDVQQISKQWVKGIHLYHDNDLFIFSNVNKDRDYTGGFRLELMTDYLKMRLFKYFGNGHDWLSYQSLLIGGEGYTPFIRFTEEDLNRRGILYEIDPDTDFFTQESFDSIGNYMRSNQQFSDRPFASFQYVGRGKYRLHHSGTCRLESLLKIGMVGGTIGDDIQSMLHQDFTTGSQRVLNWDDQIAHGGRFAINVEHKIDLSIISENSLIFNSKKNPELVEKRWLKSVNVYIPAEIALGTVHTHFGFGLGISNKSFLKTSGINDLKLVKFRGLNFFRQVWKNTYINFEYNYRRVVHNSMLEGLGFTKPFPDDPLDNEAVTVYALKEGDVNRNLHTLKWQLGFRLNKLTIYYRHVRFMNREFEVKGITPRFEDFTTPKWYGYGRIGLNFML